MSSRKETDDPWLAQVSRTADRGPRPLLQWADARVVSAMTGGPAPGQRRPPGQQEQLAQPDRGGESEPVREGPHSDEGQSPVPLRQSDGWQILSYMLGGMILYGGIGWLVSHFTGIAILFPLGMILGIGLSIAMIIFRFSRT